MPGGISISTMPLNVPAESFREKEPVVSGGSPIRSGTLVGTNTADTGLLRSEGIGAAKGGLAHFKAFILSPAQKAAEVSAVLTLETYKEALASKGGKAGLQQKLEQVVRWGRTSIAKDAFVRVGGLRDVSFISQWKYTRAAKGILRNILKGLDSRHDLILDVRHNVLENVAKSAAKIVVESDAAIDAKKVATSVATSVAEIIEKNFKEDFVAGFDASNASHALYIAEVVSPAVACCVTERVEWWIGEVVKEEQAVLASSLERLAKASDLIERRNVEAKSPAPMPTFKDVENMKTWLGPENSLERLSRLLEGLLGIKNEQSTPSSTRSAAAQLLEGGGYGMDFGRGGDQSIEAWFGSTSAEGRFEMAKKLNDWADEATELLLKSEAEKFEVKDPGQEALSLGFQYV
ncbi:hypothetical protein NPS46_06845 [Pseudomonas putida]|uniref:hypothetical protein n=1 Tax=Pseudomonas putida TaxID=303 RepID=UPI002363DE11|nr:hypothetical protein [Pseudomonas putida]MDD2052261.1 hypothetical protein [Pseudomonas putida]